MGYTEIKDLTEAVNTLNKTMDERIKSVEEWKVKWEAKMGEGGTHPPEAKAGLDAINDEISKKIAEYKALIAEQKEQRLASQRPSIFTGQYEGETHKQKSEATKAFTKWCKKKGELASLSEKERALLVPDLMDKSNMPDELKVMVSAVGDLGGVFAGTDFSAKFIQKLFLVSPIRAIADVQTISGEKLVIPTEGSTDTTIAWSDEQTGFVSSTDPNLGMLEIYARELNGYLGISRQNLEDAAWDVEAFLLKRLTRQFAQKEGTAFVSGDGVARPEGIITNTSINSYTSSTAANIVWQDLVNVMHAGKSGYRKTATWLMSNNTIGVLRQFSDTQHRPIWQLFGQEFVETLYGRPIVETPDLVNPASGQVTYTTGNIPILFGDFNQGYQIVDRVGLAFQVLHELKALQNQVLYLARMRVGGKVVLPEAITKLVIQ